MACGQEVCFATQLSRDIPQLFYVLYDEYPYLLNPYQYTSQYNERK